MSDSSPHLSSSGKTPLEDSTQEEPPQFGVVDIVEAFTAMRHEWRGQTKESRDLAEQIQATMTTLQDLETKLLNRVAQSSSPARDELKKLAQLIAETDHQFTRAVQAIEQAETHRRLRDEEQANAMAQSIARMSAVARWFARPLLNHLAAHTTVQKPTGENPGLDGLNLVLARLRRSMKELEIDRVETVGRPFDGTTMNAIGTMESPEHPSGHVAEQISPCYRWQGQVLRFADVRVAN